MSLTLRPAERLVDAMPTSDGAGVRLKRSLGSPALSMLDPFLMLDEFRSDDASDYIAGFPDHPHRGFETVTYMLAGSIEHKDSVGNTGNLTAGSLQWMTAGRGIVHSEMPRQENGLMWGFQLWVNLPAAEKMRAPRYQDIPPEDVPVVERADGVRIKVLAGEVEGRIGPVTEVVTQPQMLDVQVPADGTLDLPVPKGHNAFIYVFDGAVTVGVTETRQGTAARAGQIVVLGRGDAVRVQVGGQGGRFLLLAGAPIGEPVARHGPFVMNTREEIVQAFDDYHSGRFVT